MDYTKYTVEDLAADDSFIHWANGSNADAEKFWDAFIAAHPEMRVTISRARTLVLNLHRVETRDHSEPYIDALWERIEGRVAREADEEVVVSETGAHFPFAYAGAAVVALILAVGATWYGFERVAYHDGSAPAATALAGSDYIEEVNTSGDILRVHLSDGSTVALENNSRLRYKKSFAGEPFRSVYLTGEAFFEVAKDPRQPFLVHTADIVTRVLGTSFRVTAPDDNEAVVVSVKTGKVSVYTVENGKGDDAAQQHAVILLPNQQVTYLRDSDSFGKAIVQEPEILVPTLKAADFTFENTPIKEVFRALQRAYGIEIIFDEEVMSNCFITAPLGAEPLFEKLRVICRTIGARYETIDAKVVITSTGC